MPEFSVAVIANAIYIPLVEEPGLVKRFGSDYLAYKRNVPRWIPRPTPWHGKADAALQSRKEKRP